MPKRSTTLQGQHAGPPSEPPTASQRPRPNRPHFHCWRRAATGRAFFILGRPHRTRSVANRWLARRVADPAHRLVLACWLPECAPQLDD